MWNSRKAWQPKSVTDRWKDKQTDTGKIDPYVLCFAGDTKMTLVLKEFIIYSIIILFSLSKDIEHCMSLKYYSLHDLELSDN